MCGFLCRSVVCRQNSYRTCANDMVLGRMLYQCQPAQEMRTKFFYKTQTLYANVRAVLTASSGVGVN